MGFGFGLGAGLKALNAARLGIQTAGHNVSNANTPGFSRQRLSLMSAVPFSIQGGMQLGTGVDVGNISRIVDDSLASRINFQIGMVASANFDYRRLSEIEGVFGEPDAGLSEGLASMFGSFSQLQTDPADRSLRGGAVQSADMLADAMNLISQRLGQMESNSIAEAQAQVQELNDKARQISVLNGQIASLESNGSTANDLRDQRDLLAQELSEIANVRTLERDTGSLDILVGGHLLVAGDRTSPLAVRETATGQPEILAANAPIDITSGSLGALLSQEGSNLSTLTNRLDSLARNLALEFNRIHSTGIAGSGPFQNLTASIGVMDTDNDGMRGDELLNATGLPFDIVDGELYVNITDRATDDIERHRIEIDPRSMTLNDLAAELSSIDNLSASVDPTGKLRIQAASGYGFDFSPRLDTRPDTFGSFGSGFPSLGSAAGEPFDLSGAAFPQTFNVDVDGSVETVTLNAADFTATSAVTTDELVAAINDDLTNATARNVGDRLVIRSNSAGSSATLTLSNGVGAPLTSIGMATGPANGQDNGGVQVEVTGQYNGSENGALRFIPDRDGEIGVTSDLTVGVFDQDGTRIGTLDVGAGYDGKELEVADGISVSFTQGTINASNNNVFELETLADSDTSDVLAVLGVNAMFVGDSAGTLAVNQDLLDNPDLFAGATSSAAGDGGNLDRFMQLRDEALASFGDNTIENFYGNIVTTLGFDVSAAETTVLAEESLMTSLEQQREQISGVNIDEEMVDLVKHQQAYEAAARFVNTVQELTTTLINLGR